jgi:aminocarboxymuconate-semialdehyde decarboxylase
MRSNRRQFLKDAAGASAGMFLWGSGAQSSQSQAPPRQAGAASKRREIRMGQRRIKTVDVHSHIALPEAAEVLKGTPLEKLAGGGPTRPGTNPNSLGPERLQTMNGMGVDVQVVSINAFWYSAERDLARRLIDVQNQKLAELCAVQPDRFVALASVALQFPELAAQQMEDAMKHLGMRGAAIGGSVEGQELSSPKFDPFWAKAEELQAFIFMHPQDSAVATGVASRVQGNGFLENVIGNPLETTIFLSHLIFEGTLDRFPNLKLCAAHAGGYLPAYSGRMDQGCVTFPGRCSKTIQKKPSEYLKQLYFDAMVFTPEGLRHLIAVCGVSQLGLGSDYPFAWEGNPVDHVLNTPGLSDSDREAILGGTMRKLLKIPA